MNIYSVYDECFREYGRVIEGIDCSEIAAVLSDTPLPQGVDYCACEPKLQNLPVQKVFSENLYGGKPVQLGWCNGHNTKLNCLEYHRSSEFNFGTEEFVLLLAKQSEIQNGMLDTGKVKAFRAPAGVLIEVYATTLHYAPCHIDENKGFRVLVALPQGTNGEKPQIQTLTEEDKLLWACDKWLLAHADSDEAAQGAHVGLTGENIDLKNRA